MSDNDDLLPMPRNSREVKVRGRARDIEAMRLKALGWSLEDICKQLDLGPDVSRAGAAIKRAMLMLARFAAEEFRLIELYSLDELEAEVWRELKAHHILVSNGRIIRDEDGEPLTDDRFVLEATDRILRIKERRARMLGLDAPARAEIFTIDSVDAEIARLEDEVRRAKSA
jgi:hypothetical protein